MCSPTPTHRSQSRVTTKSLRSLTLPPSPSPPSLSPNSCIPIPVHQILGLPPPLLNLDKAQVPQQMATPEENPVTETHRRCKSTRTTGCNSPKNPRRCRRKRISEVEEAEQTEIPQETTVVGRRRRSCRLRKPRLSLILSAPTIPSAIDDDDQGCPNGVEQQLTDLFMWKDMAKSSLWFGLGSLFFLSSSLAGGLLRFSFISAMSKVGLLCLGLSFLSNSCFRREKSERKWENNRLKEEDILRACRILLPAADFAVARAREMFSGEPLVTLKVAPIFLLGSEYGHLFTMWRLFAFGFFASFTIPKLWSQQSANIRKQADHLIWRVSDAWGACSHKKFVAASAITLFWNLTCVKFRVLALFAGFAMLRCRQKANSEKEMTGMEQHEGEPLVEGDTAIQI